MASWLKAKLFGRQLSYGSDNPEPQNFEEALQQQQIEPQQSMGYPVQQAMGSCSEASPVPGPQIQQQVSFGETASPGAKEMKAAYEVINIISMTSTSLLFFFFFPIRSVKHW